eukprot:gene11805-15797_t
MITDFSEDFMDGIAAVQEGNVQVIHHLISRKQISVHSVDNSNCSLLHWAALNNRTEIANYLIDQGVMDCRGGGLLDETPLHWALRRKFYFMASLLVRRLNCDLNYKSKQGSDCLNMACKLGDINAIFLLLHWGANPNSIDNNGDTSLIWLIKNRSSSSISDIVRLLFRFGADPLCPNPSTGNTALHELAENRSFDLSLAFLIYDRGGNISANIANANGFTPYTQAVHANNRMFTRFLYDALLFKYLPYWFPTVVSALVISLLFIMVDYFGTFLGIVYWVALYYLLSVVAFQLTVRDHVARLDVGLFGGMFVSSIFIYHNLWSSSINSYWQLVISINYICLILVVFKMSQSKPLAVKSTDKNELASKIINSSPYDGPNEEILGEETDNEDHPILNNNRTRRSGKYLRNLVTGDMIKTSIDDNVNIEAGLRERTRKSARSLGPRLCGTCLCDKRFHNMMLNNNLSIHSGSNGNHKPGRSMFDSSLSTTDQNIYNASHFHMNGNVSIATHCNFCGCCVIDVDHHCSYLGSCIGIGNKRMFWLCLISGSIHGLLMFFISKSVQYQKHCNTDESGIVWSALSNEYCWLNKRPSEAIMSWMCGFVGISLFLSFIAQIIVVGSETTISNVSKNRHENKRIKIGKAIRLIASFLRTGFYTVRYAKSAQIPSEGDRDTSTLLTPERREEKKQNIMMMSRDLEPDQSHHKSIHTFVNSTTSNDDYDSEFVDNMQSDQSDNDESEIGLAKILRSTCLK